MEAISSLGALTFFAGIIAIPIALLLLLVAAIDKNKKTRKIGLYMLLGGSVTLLISFSLCSIAPLRLD